MLKYRLAGVVVSALIVTACEQTFQFEGQYQEGEREVFYKSTYSTRLDGAYEKSGTVFESQHKVSWTVGDDQWIWERTPLAFEAKGWNKNLIPREWINSIPMRVTAGKESISFSSFKPLYDSLSAFKQHEALQRRLMVAADTLSYIRELKLRRHLMRMVPSGKYRKRQNLELTIPEDLLGVMRADSIVVTGERRRNGHQCFEYSLYYTTEDSLRLDVEQLFISFQSEMNKFQINYWQSSPEGGPRILQKGLWEKETLKGEWHFSLDRSSGIPCYESKKEEAVILLDHPGAVRKINATIFRFLEYVYR